MGANDGLQRLWIDSAVPRRDNSRMTDRKFDVKQSCLILLGAAAGGAVGYFVFFWLTQQGLYGLVLPGGLLGLGAGIFRTRSIAVAATCGVLALGLGLFAEWRFAPFNANDGFIYFLSHFYQLKPMTLVMIVAGAVIGFWVPFSRVREVEKVEPDGEANAVP